MVRVGWRGARQLSNRTDNNSFDRLFRTKRRQSPGLGHWGRRSLSLLRRARPVAGPDRRKFGKRGHGSSGNSAPSPWCSPDATAPDFCNNGSGAGELGPRRSVHASPTPFRMSSTLRKPDTTARSVHRRAADQNAVRCAAQQKRFGEPPRRARYGRLHHKHTDKPVTISVAC